MTVSRILEGVCLWAFKLCTTVTSQERKQKPQEQGRGDVAFKEHCRLLPGMACILFYMFKGRVLTRTKMEDVEKKGGSYYKHNCLILVLFFVVADLIPPPPF